MIRKAVKKDFEEIYQLGELLHQNYRKVYDFDELEKQDYFHLYVFEKQNKVVGFIAYTELLDLIDILDLAVHPDFRKQKIATNLMDYVITQTDPKYTICLEVASENINAISLYEKFGFKKIHTRKDYYETDDAIIMERRIEND